jgi:beta-galactosidase/beta-glucuronidase
MSKLDELLIGTPHIEPSIARVTVLATCTEPADDLRLEGHLTGPVCAYSRTIEATMRLVPETPRGKITGTAVLQAGGNLSEPCLWEPEHPFLYHGAVELWQDDRKLDERAIEIGVRLVGATSDQLLLNGHPTVLGGVRLPQTDRVEVPAIRQWREAGCQAIFARRFDEAALREADRVGVLLVVYVTEAEDVMAQRLHPSVGVWAVDSEGAIAAVRRADPFRPMALLHNAAEASGSTEAEVILAVGRAEETAKLAQRAAKPVLACCAGGAVAPETFARALENWKSQLAGAARVAGWFV